mgnify:FL=1
MRGKVRVVAVLREINDTANPHEIWGLANAMGAGLRYNIIQGACTTLDQQGHIFSIPDYGPGEAGCDSARLVLAAEFIEAVPDPKVYRRVVKPAPFPIEAKQALRDYIRTGRGDQAVVELAARRNASIAAAFAAMARKRQTTDSSD